MASTVAMCVVSGCPEPVVQRRLSRPKPRRQAVPLTAPRTGARAGCLDVLPAGV